jgi:predicted dehydrogenase
MKIVIFGLGSIGSRHAKILKKYFSHEVIAFRHRTSRSNTIKGIKEISKWAELARLKPDVAFITNPTNMHIKTAIQCARLGMHLFIEKPLSNDLQGLTLLKSICQKNDLTCYTAYCLRFHPVIKTIKKMVEHKKIYHVRVVCSSYLLDWPGRNDPNATYSAQKKMGGGVLLDLSHEFDYLKYIFGDFKEIKSYYGKVSKVTSDAEDFADVLIRTKKGLTINLHINFMSKISKREIVIDHEHGYIVADLNNYTIESLLGNKNSMLRYPIDRDGYLKEQSVYYFRHLGETSIMNGLSEAMALLKKIMEIKHEKG